MHEHRRIRDLREAWDLWPRNGSALFSVRMHISTMKQRTALEAVAAFFFDNSNFSPSSFLFPLFNKKNNIRPLWRPAEITLKKKDDKLEQWLSIEYWTWSTRCVVACNTVQRGQITCPATANSRRKTLAMGQRWLRHRGESVGPLFVFRRGIPQGLSLSLTIFFCMRFHHAVSKLSCLIFLSLIFVLGKNKSTANATTWSVRRWQIYCSAPSLDPQYSEVLCCRGLVKVGSSGQEEKGNCWGDSKQGVVWRVALPLQAKFFFVCLFCSFRNWEDTFFIIRTIEVIFHVREVTA